MSDAHQRSIIYLKIIEAKDIKAADFGGTSDPYVVITTQGNKKASLRTRTRKKTLKPKWNEEFLVSVERSSPNEPSTPHNLIELHLWDWNRLTSHEHLDCAKLQIDTLPVDEPQDMWIKFAKKGSIRVLVKVGEIAQFPEGKIPPPISEKVPVCRIQVERRAYYPGETIRGAIVVNVPKANKSASLGLIVRSETKTVFTVNPHGLSPTNYIFGEGQISIFEDKPLSPGCRIFPFECDIPIVSPPTTEVAMPTVESCNTFYLLATLERSRPGKESPLVLAAMDVPLLPLTGYRLPRIEANLLPSPPDYFDELDHHVSSPDSPVDFATLRPQLWPVECYWFTEGSTQAWVGEKYKFRCKIANLSNNWIDSLQVNLTRFSHFISTANTGNDWGRSPFPEVTIPISLALEDHPEGLPEGFPIEPGATWAGEITVQLPPNCQPSLHCSISPLVQISYGLSIVLQPTQDFHETNTLGRDLPIVLLRDNYDRPPPRDILKKLPPYDPPTPATSVLRVWSDGIDGSFQFHDLLVPTLVCDEDPHFAGMPLMPLFETAATNTLEAQIKRKPMAGDIEWKPGTLPVVMLQEADSMTIFDDNFSEKFILEAIDILRQQFLDNQEADEAEERRYSISRHLHHNALTIESSTTVP